MDYIINPIYFYLMTIFNKLNALSFIILTFSTLILVAFAIDIIEIKKNKKYFIATIIIFIINLLIFIFIPDAKTMKEMLISNLIIK